MRKIKKSKRSPIPGILAKNKTLAIQNLVQSKTLKASDFDSSIYGSPAVRKRLLKDQYEKCAYCEKKVSDDIPDVEHFRPKTKCKQAEKCTRYLGYWWLAYEWKNLLYSCATCNSKYKKNFFPLQQPHKTNPTKASVKNEVPLLINPTTENPRTYIVFNRNKILPKNQNIKGVTTIKVLGLNRRELKDVLRLNQWNNFMLAIDALQSMGKKHARYKEIKKRTEKIFLSNNSAFVGMFENQQTPIVL